jgi:hypothetical protein
VGLRSLKRVSRLIPDDCTGLIRLALKYVGIQLDGSSNEMYRLALERRALHRRVPSPGDLVFFRETYDKNRDGQRNDGMTHVGIVERVGRDGTVTFIHRGMRGVSRSQLNVKRPRQRQGPDGQELNDYLRPASAISRAYMTGELFSGYASLEALK